MAPLLPAVRRRPVWCVLGLGWAWADPPREGGSASCEKHALLPPSTRKQPAQHGVGGGVGSRRPALALEWIYEVTGVGAVCISAMFWWVWSPCACSRQAKGLSGLDTRCAAQQYCRDSRQRSKIAPPGAAREPKACSKGSPTLYIAFYYFLTPRQTSAFRLSARGV
jgi:hypothetical protein